MATGLELYEALKPTVGEDAARMIAEALPLTDRVATKTDLQQVADQIRSDIRGDIQEAKSDMFRWMLGFFATLWLGNVGVIVTLLVKL
jgi:hypothetical protein